MSFYGRFEQIVTWILTLCIAVIIAIALFRLVATINARVTTGTDRLGIESITGNTLRASRLWAHNDLVFHYCGSRCRPRRPFSRLSLGP
jgi:hypothetical protein